MAHRPGDVSFVSPSTAAENQPLKDFSAVRRNQPNADRCPDWQPWQSCHPRSNRGVNLDILADEVSKASLERDTRAFGVWIAREYFADKMKSAPNTYLRTSSPCRLSSARRGIHESDVAVDQDIIVFSKRLCHCCVRERVPTCELEASVSRRSKRACGNSYTGPRI